MAVRAKSKYTRVRAKAEKIPGTTVTDWSSDACMQIYPNYNCDKCNFSSIFAFKMREHIAEGIHVWKKPAPKGLRKKQTKPQGAIY